MASWALGRRRNISKEFSVGTMMSSSPLAKDRMFDVLKSVRRLTTPGADGFDLSLYGLEGDWRVPIRNSFVESLQERSSLLLSVDRLSEEQELLRVFAGDFGLLNHSEENLPYLLDTRAAGWAGAREDHLASPAPG
jgi:hypothetical protein